MFYQQSEKARLKVRPCGTERNGTRLFMAVRSVRPGTKRGNMIPGIFIKILKDVSCEYDRWVVETQLCKLRDRSDTLVGRVCAMSVSYTHLTLPTIYSV